MARIRSVKPELWTDSDFVELSIVARLLFVALWNFASDYGVLPDKPKQLKMQCLPGDNVEIVPLLDELVTRRFLVRTCDPTGTPVLIVRTFTQHQKVDKRTPGRWGDPATWTNPPLNFGEDSPSAPRIPPTDRTGQDRTGGEWKGEDEDRTAPALVRQLRPVPDEPQRSSSFDATIEIASEAITDQRNDVNASDREKYARGVAKNLREERSRFIDDHLAAGETPVAIAALLADSRVSAVVAARNLGYQAMEA